MKSKLNQYLLYFENNPFKQGNIIFADSNQHKLIVKKIYRYNLWRKALNFFGFKFKLLNCIKIKEVE